MELFFFCFFLCFRCIALEIRSTDSQGGMYQLLPCSCQPGAESESESGGGGGIRARGGPIEDG